jgi:hypothetical protein
MEHLAYCDDKAKVLEGLLDGTRTMLIRGAAGRKIPHSRVFEGEKIYFIKRGTGEISAKGVVKSVQNFVKLSEDEIIKTLDQNQAKLGLTAKEQKRWHKRCLCLVEVKDVEAIMPLAFDRQSNMDDWLIIEKIEDVVVGTSIPYNYDKSKF